MEKTYYNSIVLDKYLVRPEKLSNEKICIEYSDGQNYRSKGAHYQKDISLLLWDSRPTKEMFDIVEYLDIIPPVEYLFPKFTPSFISDFSKLKTLKMPLIYALSLTSQNYPVTVNNLTLINDRKQTENLCSFNDECVEKYQFSEICYPNVEGLHLVTLSTASASVDNLLNLNEKIFPDLKFLRCSINAKKADGLSISNMSKLKHLWVSIGKDIDIMKYIPDSLETLYIDGTNSVLNFLNIKNEVALKILKINSCRFDIDCEDFIHIKGIKELIISNSKNIKNIEAILNIDSLKSIEFVNCRNVFSKTQKQLFKSISSKYERLSIDFA
jgi:hypothetical protein